jgi:hypothetical protein
VNPSPKHLQRVLRGVLAIFVFALAAETRLARADDLSGWKSLAEGGAAVGVALDSASPRDEQNTNSLRLTVKNSGARAGIVHLEIAAADLRPGQWRDLTFYARTEARKTFALTVSLESRDGQKIRARATIPEVGGAWTKYTLALNVRQPGSKCRMVITMAEPGTIWLNGISFATRQNPQNPGP